MQRKYFKSITKIIKKFEIYILYKKLKSILFFYNIKMTEKFGDFLKRVHTYELSKWNLKDLKATPYFFACHGF